MGRLRVLISGAGIAGAVLAHWLAKHDVSVTLVERSPELRLLGQIIDIEGVAVEIAERMGVLETIKARRTGEAGIKFFTEAGTLVGTIPEGMSSISKSIEIMRGDLADALLSLIGDNPNVKILYNSTISTLQQSSDCVSAEIYSKDTETSRKETFDLLVAADGIRSSTRDLIVPSPERETCVKPIGGVFGMFFSVPRESADSPYARVLSLSGRRTVVIKPFNDKESSAYLTVITNDPRFEQARVDRDSNVQKSLIAEAFSGIGWEVSRLLRAMSESKNCYFEHFSQIRLSRWDYGRCILLGDTAYAPSPLTGQGTKLAITGAYFLANEIIKNKDNSDIAEVGRKFDEIFRPYVDKTQPIPLGGWAPYIANPYTRIGVWFIRGLVALVSRLALYQFLSTEKGDALKLPDLH